MKSRVDDLIGCRSLHLSGDKLCQPRMTLIDGKIIPMNTYFRSYDGYGVVVIFDIVASVFSGIRQLRVEQRVNMTFFIPRNSPLARVGFRLRNAPQKQKLP